VRSLVVVPHVLVEHSPKLASSPDRHPVQALLPGRPHPALGERVGVRRLDRGRDDPGAVGGEHVVVGAGELAVPVANEEPRCAGQPYASSFSVHRELSCLLDRPRSVRVVADASKPNLPRVQLDEEQHVEGLEAHGLHGEEVGGDDAGGLRPKERSPADRRPAGRGPKPVAQQHRPDGRRRHRHAEVLGFALDAPVAPARVLPGQPQDQRNRVVIERWTTASTVGLGPLAPDQPPVPPQDRARRHQEDRPAPAR